MEKGETGRDEAALMLAWLLGESVDATGWGWDKAQGPNSIEEGQGAEAIFGGWARQPLFTLGHLLTPAHAKGPGVSPEWTHH
jgi:hypothetical protein